MEKIAALLRFENDFTVDINIMQEQQEKIITCHNNILQEAIESHLGRPIDLDKDAHRFSSRTVQNTNVTDYYIDSVLIGSITTTMGYEYLDFENNKFSCEIKFTPALYVKSRPY